MLTLNTEDRGLPDGLVARPLAHRKASICAKLLQLKGLDALCGRIEVPSR